MNRRAVAVVDRAELIKWYDALDALTGNTRPRDVEKGLRMARECQHPDARWLAALFPPGAGVTQQRIHEEMLEQGDDPRATWLAWACGGRQEEDEGLLRRAAGTGYAPAQVALATLPGGGAEFLSLLEKAGAQNDRNALFVLGQWRQRQGDDAKKAIDLLRRAAELNQRLAQVLYARFAFGASDGNAITG
jgi:TPR repeat protein